MADFQKKQENHEPDFVSAPSTNVPVYRAAAQVAQSTPIARAGVPPPLNLTKQSAAPKAVSSLVLAPITPRVTSSVAPKKPCTVAGTSFVIKDASYEEIQMKVSEILSKAVDYDYSYVPDNFQWICKAVQGVNFREYCINCYWDYVNEEHVIEVLKSRGEGLNLNFVDLFDLLLLGFHNRAITSQPPRKRTLSPLPLRSSTTTPVALSNEQFLAGIQSIFIMAQDHFYEPKLEAAKMLCELAKRSKCYLELPECVEKCADVLEKLMKDDFDDIRNFAILAFADFSELQVYQQKFCERQLLSAILSLVDNCPLDSLSFDCAHLRRRAASSIAAISSNYPEAAMEALCQSGFSNEEEWLAHTNKLQDGRTRSLSLRIAQCLYQSPVSVNETFEGGVLC